MSHNVPIALLWFVLAARADAQKADQVELPVTAHMDIYRAGGYNDGSDGTAPTVYSFPAATGRLLYFSSVSGEWSCSNRIASFGPDGSTSGLCYGNSIMNPVGTLSGFNSTDFAGAMAGVFLEDDLPAVPRPPLRFYLNSPAQGGIQTSFRAITPKIGEIFFIGDGLTGTGTGGLQGFAVPSTATHLYLGFIDTCEAVESAAPGCYSDNVGSLHVIFQFQTRALDWVQPQLSVSPPARCCGGMAFDSSTSSTVLFGGGNGGIHPGSRFDDTWTFRNGWTRLSPANSPSPRQGPGMAYDAKAGNIVLFGGGDDNGALLSDTWIWDGLTWTQQFPPTSPPARELDAQAMVYDAASGTVLLFGGGSPNGVLADTWEWDGALKTWTQRLPASSPSARRTNLVYDSGLGAVVLYGGDSATGDCCDTYFNDTWIWNGSDWIQQFPTSSPPGRALPALGYDASNGQAVMFGGYRVPGQGLNDTWSWNGKNWTKLKLPSSPGGRWAADMVYDPFAKGLLLFGGEVTGDPFANDLWVFKLIPIL